MALTMYFMRPVDGIPLWKFALRVTWIALELILVWFLGQRGSYFFYQGF